MLSSQGMRHTVGWKFAPSHTPPVPSADASQVPAAVGVSCTSLLTWVSRAPREWMICRRSVSVAHASLCLPRPIIFGAPRIALYNGVMKPFAAGRIRVALETRPTRDRKRLDGLDLLPPPGGSHPHKR
jgi:hypothetical protein